MTESDLSLRIGDLARRLSLLERKVDFMLLALKLDYQEPPEPQYMSQVRALAAAHKQIDAIKLYREHTGVSLVEAKEFIDHL